MSEWDFGSKAGDEPEDEVTAALESLTAPFGDAKKERESGDAGNSGGSGRSSTTSSRAGQQRPSVTPTPMQQQPQQQQQQQSSAPRPQVPQPQAPEQASTPSQQEAQQQQQQPPVGVGQGATAADTGAVLDGRSGTLADGAANNASASVEQSSTAEDADATAATAAVVGNGDMREPVPVERTVSQDSDAASVGSSTEGEAEDDDQFVFDDVQDDGSSGTATGTAVDGCVDGGVGVQPAQQQPAQPAQQVPAQPQAQAQVGDQQQQQGQQQQGQQGQQGQQQQGDGSKPPYILTQEALLPIQDFLKRSCEDKPLSAGDYQFNLRARKNDGSKKMFTVTFVINCKTSNALGFSKSLVSSGFLRDSKDQMELIRGLDFLINRPEAIAYHLAVYGREDLPPLNSLNVNSLPEQVAVILLVRHRPLGEPCKSLIQRAQETKRKEKKHKKLKKEKREKEKKEKKEKQQQEQGQQDQEQGEGQPPGQEQEEQVSRQPSMQADEDQETPQPEA